MNSVGRAIAFGLSPTLGGWLEFRANPPTEPGQPFSRRLRPYDFWILALGVIVILFGSILDIRFVWLMGAVYVALGLLRPLARALIPQRFAETEMQFVLLTNPQTLIRLGLWILLAFLLINEEWIVAAMIGALQLFTFVLGVATFLAIRLRARRKRDAFAR